MTCCICKNGETQPGHTSVILERDDCTLLFKNVPADICENCGEYYLDETTAGSLLARANDAARSNTVLQVIHYAA